MAPARLHERQAVIGQQHRQGAAQEIGRRHEVGIEHGDEGRIGMGEAKGQVAGLEALAVAAAQQLQVDAFGHDRGQALRQHGVIVCIAVVQQLNGQAIARPVQRTGGGSDAQRNSAFIADRQLHQHMRQLRFGHLIKRKDKRLARQPQPAQQGKLKGQHANRDEDDGKGGGKGIAEHGDGQAPLFPLSETRFRAPPAFPQPDRPNFP